MNVNLYAFALFMHASTMYMYVEHVCSVLVVDARRAIESNLNANIYWLATWPDRSHTKRQANTPVNVDAVVVWQPTKTQTNARQRRVVVDARIHLANVRREST